ncbi:MAG: MFS transporter [Candidatus Omnitrophica bacterium]|nr:MFS transporter [Candidatus Omnitrophota bacterium]
MKQLSPLMIVFFTVFLDLLGFGILIPLLPYVGKTYLASDIQIGLLMASYSIAQFLFAPMWGRLSDWIGRRPVMLISLIGSTCGYALFAMADSLAMLFASRILAGCAAANISTAQAIVADCLPPEKRTKGMGMVGAAIGLGFVLGPALAGLLVGSESNYTLPFTAAAILSGIDLVLAYFLLPETFRLRRDQHLEERRFSLRRLQEALKVRYIPRLLFTSLLYYAAFAAMESIFALYGFKMFGMSERQNSAILFMVGVIMVLIQGGAIRYASKRFGDQNLLAFGVCGVMAGLAFMGLSNSITALTLSAIVMAASSGFAAPALISLASQLSADEVQGGILGLNQSMASLGRILGPILGTMLFQFITPRAPFFFCAWLVLGAFFIILPLRHTATFKNTLQEAEIP